MSLARLPTETITHIFDLLDESDVEMPLNISKHRQMCKVLMALRLTCKDLEGVATRQLFRTLYISKSSRSWLNAHTVAANPDFRLHLQTLVFDSDDDKNYYGRGLKKAIKLLKLRFLDFSLFPNLKVLKGHDNWILREKNARSNNVEIPLGRYGIYLTATGAMITDFDEMTWYGFRLTSVNCSIRHSIWQLTKSLDLSSLKSLWLLFNQLWWYQLRLEPNLDHLKDLPNLEEFHMNQFYPYRYDNDMSLHSMTNVLELLANVRNWPRLRHLDLRYLVARVDDLKAFVVPHAAAGTLKTLEIHGHLIWAHVTPEEEQKRVDLPHWIKTVVCPDGGGATFKHVLGPPGELHEAEFSLSSSEESNTDTEDSDTKDPDTEVS